MKWTSKCTSNNEELFKEMFTLHWIIFSVLDQYNSAISLKLKESHRIDSEETLLFFHLETAQGIFKNIIIIKLYK